MDSLDGSDLFLRSCGCRAALAITVERQGSRGAQPHVLRSPFVLLGRDERNHVCLADGEVSRRHAYWQVLDGAVYCVDLGSRTGVRWHGEPRQADWVSAEDALQIGPFFVSLAEGALPVPHDGPEPWRPLAPDSPGSPPAPAWSLELPSGVRWQVNRALTLVGKSPRCKLRPNSPGASQFHCSLVRAVEGVWVVDLLSRKGTYVNGERVRWALLEEGDELRIDRVVLHLRGEASDASGVSIALGEGAGAAFLSPPPEGQAEEDIGAEGPGPAEAAPPGFPLLPRAPSGGSLAPQASSPGELPQALLAPVINQFSLMQQQMLEQFHQTMTMMAQMFGTIHRDQMALIRDELQQLHRVTQELQTLHVELAKRGSTPGEGEVGPRPAVQEKGPEAAPARPPQPTAGPVPDRPAPRPASTPENIHALLRQRLAALEQERKTRWERVLKFMLGR
jgi:pSer/pThr/pTyr-binding forkhead associated (FHA) protein